LILSRNGLQLGRIPTLDIKYSKQLISPKLISANST